MVVGLLQIVPTGRLSFAHTGFWVWNIVVLSCSTTTKSDATVSAFTTFTLVTILFPAAKSNQFANLYTLLAAAHGTFAARVPAHRAAGFRIRGTRSQVWFDRNFDVAAVIRPKIQRVGSAEKTLDR